MLAGHLWKIFENYIEKKRKKKMLIIKYTIKHTFEAIHGTILTTVIRLYVLD